ncbi:hypothetical protein TWF173_003142 [Orbilia oligospora]|nr:hypothetical protein TWF173_003142 [Orbilia oligospora]
MDDLDIYLKVTIPMIFSSGYEGRNYHSGTEPANRKLCRRHQRFLQDLTVRQVQDVIGPEKRASVAVVIRLRPSSVPSPPYSGDDSETRLGRGFNSGDIIIKRSSRAGDRWTGHVALPGGRRDKSDEGDEVTAVRECMEEVGLDLTSEDCLLCGALPQRVIITNWGQKPLMVLCPYVFLWTKEEVPEFKLEAAEVAAAFWIPIHFLLDDKHKTEHPVDVSDRMASSTFQPLRPFFKILLGPMYFSAVQLKPSEVSHSAASTTARGDAISTDKGQAMGDLMLWGITYAILADMLDFLPPFNFVESFQYPSFGGWDFRSLVWMLSRGYRRGRKEDLMEYKFSDVIGMRTVSGVRRPHDARGARISIIDHLIKGYYGFVRQAAYATITFRIAAFGAIVQYLITTN